MGEVEEIQEKMKANMEAIKEKMATMMEAMMSVKKIMEAFLFSSSSRSLYGRNSTLSLTSILSYPNFVRGPLLDDMRPFFGPREVLGTHH